MSAFIIVDWKPILRKSLVAQTNVRMPSGVQTVSWAGFVPSALEVLHGHA